MTIKFSPLQSRSFQFSSVHFRENYSIYFSSPFHFDALQSNWVLSSPHRSVQISQFMSVYCSPDSFIPTHSSSVKIGDIYYTPLLSSQDYFSPFNFSPSQCTRVLPCPVHFSPLYFGTVQYFELNSTISTRKRE